MGKLLVSRPKLERFALMEKVELSKALVCYHLKVVILREKLRVSYK
jgi:hypothetical protein